MKKIHIFGHKNPDTDSICSTIAYAHLKRELGYDSATACRLGELNDETKFVLNFFNMEVPEFIEDVEAKLSDLTLYPPSIVSKHDPIKRAWDILKEAPRSRLIPVVDKDNILEGIISISDITRHLMEYSDINVTQKYEILFDNFLEILDSEVKYGSYKFRKIEGRIIIGSPDNNDTLDSGDILITSRISSAKKYRDTTNVGCIIVTNNRDISELSNSNIAIVTVAEDIYRVVSYINQSISIGSIMRTKDLITFSENNSIEEIKNVLKDSPHRNFPVIQGKGSLIGIISRRHIIDYPKRAAILIDHNERGQSAEGIENAEILEVIDHHRVADIQTDQPLYIRSEPVGCTATIVYRMYRENLVEIPKNIAGVMLSAILSDTLIFTSPTCTDKDRVTAEELADIAEVDLQKYAKKMFEAGSSDDLGDLERLLIMDCKAFTFGTANSSISQINTLNINKLLKDQDEIFRELELFNSQRRNDLTILMVTDITKSGSQIFISGKEKDLARRAFNIENKENTIFLEGVVSRKKQVVPKLMMATRHF